MIRLSDITRRLCEQFDISQAELARKTGQAASNFSRKLKNDNVGFEEFQQYLKVLGARCELSVFREGESGPELPVASEPHKKIQLSILEQELEQERKIKRYFLSSDHGLRTSFGIISGATELLLTRCAGDTEAMELLRQMQTAENEVLAFMREISGFYGMVRPTVESGAVSDIGAVRALLVDDSEISRGITKSILEDHGALVDEAADGRAAVERVRNSAPGEFNIILMDLEMPRMNGLEAARRIRALPDAGLAAIPMVALTASAGEADRRRAFAAGMNDFLLKPTDVNSLLKTVRFLSRPAC